MKESTPEYGFENVSKAARHIRKEMKKAELQPSNINDGLILGNDLGKFAIDYLGKGDNSLVIPYNEIFEKLDLPVNENDGDNQEIIISTIKGADENDKRLVMTLNGREIPYEGASTERAVFFIRVMQVLGVKNLIGSNSAKILTPDSHLRPPTLSLNESMIDLNNDNPSLNDERFGPSNPDMTNLYSKKFREIIEKVARKAEDAVLIPGMYVRGKGPGFETPENIYYVRHILDGLWKEGKKQEGDSRFGGLLPQVGRPTGVLGNTSTYEAIVAKQAMQSKRYPAFQEGIAYISTALSYAANLGPKGVVEPLSDKDLQKKLDNVYEEFSAIVQGAILEMRKRSS